MVVGSGDKSNVAELSFRRRLHPNMLLGCRYHLSWTSIEASSKSRESHPQMRKDLSLVGFACLQKQRSTKYENE